MMNFANLERAHLTLAFLREFPDAVDVRIHYHPATEQIRAVLKLRDGQTCRFTFQAGSDDDEYLFVNVATPSDQVRIEPLPVCLLEA